MKKFFLLATSALLCISSFAQTQGDDNGFGLKLFAGFAGNKYGTAYYEDISNENRKYDLPGLKKTPAFGLALENRWYVANPGRFGIAVNARWIDFSFASKKYDYRVANVKYADTKNTYIKVGLLGAGPMGTFYLNDRMAVDLYYNIMPAMMFNKQKNEFVAEQYLPSSDSDEENEDFNFGISADHFFGAAFRLSILQIGIEYNISRPRYISFDDDDDDDYWDYHVQKFNLNNFRVFVGLKF